MSVAENDWFIFQISEKASQYDFLLFYSCVDSEYPNIVVSQRSLRGFQLRIPEN